MNQFTQIIYNYLRQDFARAEVIASIIAPYEDANVAGAELKAFWLDNDPAMQGTDVTVQLLREAAEWIEWSALVRMIRAETYDDSAAPPLTAVVGVSLIDTLVSAEADDTLLTFPDDDDGVPMGDIAVAADALALLLREDRRYASLISELLGFRGNARDFADAHLNEPLYLDACEQCGSEAMMYEDWLVVLGLAARILIDESKKGKSDA